MKYDRRKFIKISGLAIGASVFTLSCKINYPGYYFFTNDEALCVLAICEQIIPADKDPGATDAGVIHYIDRQLISYFKDQQDFYRNGIIAFQKSCMNIHNCRFEQMELSKQTEFLEKLDTGKIQGEEWKDIKPEFFFNTLVNHTMQGFYGSPRHGGNKDYVSYAMMGLEYPQVIGQNRYRD